MYDHNLNASCFKLPTFLRWKIKVFLLHFKARLRLQQRRWWDWKPKRKILAHTIFFLSTKSRLESFLKKKNLLTQTDSAQILHFGFSRNKRSSKFYPSTYFMKVYTSLNEKKIICRMSGRNWFGHWRASIEIDRTIGRIGRTGST